MAKENRTHQWAALERQDWQVWFLSTLLLLIVGAGLLSLMFPAVFWDTNGPALRSPERAFFGFGVLYAMTLAYLLKRHATVQQLRRQLVAAQEDATEAARVANHQVLQALPSMVSFRDSLAMEFRRASMAGHPLGTATVSLRAKSEEQLGLLARIFTSVIRPGESLFRVSDNGLAVILPKMASNEVAALVSQVEAAMSLRPEDLSLNVVSYPSEATSFAELEGKLRNLKLSA